MSVMSHLIEIQQTLHELDEEKTGFIDYPKFEKFLELHGLQDKFSDFRKKTSFDGFVIKSRERLELNNTAISILNQPLSANSNLIIIDSMIHDINETYQQSSINSNKADVQHALYTTCINQIKFGGCPKCTYKHNFLSV